MRATASALLVLTSLVGLSVASSPSLASSAASPPVNRRAPAITGSPQVSSYLTASTGSWSNSPTSFRYHWFADGKSLQSKTGETLFVSPSEQNENITVAVTAVNAAGAASARSAKTPKIADTPWKDVRFPSHVTPQRVACSSVHACFAIARGPNYPYPAYFLTFHGQRWSSPSRLGSAMDADISCAADGFCLLVAGRQASSGRGWWYRTYDHGKWSGRHAMPRLPSERYGEPWVGGYFMASCWSRALCSAVMGGTNGQVCGGGCASGGWLVLYTATTHEVRAPADPTWMPANHGRSHWTAPIQATSGHHLWMAACTSTKSCVVSDDLKNTVAYFNGRTWSHEVQLGFGYVGCSTARLCIASDSYDAHPEWSRVWNGHSWSLKHHWLLAAAQCHGALGCFGLQLRQGGSDRFRTCGSIVHITGRSLVRTGRIGLKQTSNQGLCEIGGGASEFGYPEAEIACASTLVCLAAGGSPPNVGPVGGGSYAYHSTYRF